MAQLRTSSSSTLSPPSRARLAKRLLAIAAAASIWAPSAAKAEEFSGGGGVYVSFTFGKELGVGYGIEGHMMGLLAGTETCSSNRRAGVGGMFQLGGINGSTLRMIVGAQGGTELGDLGTPALIGEIGLAAHLAAKSPGVGLHSGLMLDTGYSANIFGRAEWFLEEYSVGVGGRFLGTFGVPGGQTCVIGRPLRDAHGRVDLPSARSEDARAEQPRIGCSTEGRAESTEWLAAEWSNDTQGEAASVPAFLQLAAELMALDAPASLVDAALDAAEDEVRHARTCARLASRWSGRRVTPVLPVAPAWRPPSLERLAIESWVDGCLGEGAAAERARVGAVSASERGTARALGMIASDEARHAELGWHILDWALAVGGSAVSESVRAHRDVHLAEERGEAPRDALAHGRVPPSLINALHARHAEGARRRLDARLIAA